MSGDLPAKFQLIRERRAHDATRWWLFGIGCALIVSAGMNAYLLLR